jgi:hypothetical protein
LIGEPVGLAGVGDALSREPGVKRPVIPSAATDFVTYFDRSSVLRS